MWDLSHHRIQRIHDWRFKFSVPVSTLIVVPLWTYIADKFHAARTILFLGSAISCISMMSLTKLSAQSATISLTLVNAFFSRPISPIYDRHVLSYLGPSRKEEYGMQRVYGAYGWGAGALLCSQLLEPLGWVVIASIYMALQVLFCVVVKRTASVEVVVEERAVKELLHLVMKDPPLMVFLTCVALIGAGSSVITSFLFLFLKQIGGSDTLLGVSLVFTVVVEIPMFANSKRLLNRFGVRNLIMSAMLCYVVRVIGYSFLANPWYVLLLEPLHGFTLAWLHVARGSLLHGGGTARQVRKYLSRVAIGVLLGDRAYGWLNLRRGCVPFLRGTRYVSRCSAHDVWDVGSFCLRRSEIHDFSPTCFRREG